MSYPQLRTLSVGFNTFLIFINYVNKNFFNLSRACAQNLKSVILLHRATVCRLYSTDSTSSSPLIPVIKYANADIDKLLVLKETKGKAGVYKWVNLENGKSYIGSSVNLSRRFRDYYSIRFLEKEIKKNKSMIYRSLLKYGYSNFSVEILEYCAPSEVISREQYYFGLLKPEYNILITAGSLFGFKHSEETIAKMSTSAKAKFWTPEHKAKRLEHLKRLNLSQKGLARPEGAGVPSVSIEVFDTLNNEATVYPSIREAARFIGCYDTTVGRALKIKMEKGVNRLIKKRYTVSPHSNNKNNG